MPPPPGRMLRTVGIFQAQRRKVLAEFFQAFHLKGQVGEVGLDFYRPAAREAAQFNHFRAVRRLHEDQLPNRAAIYVGGFPPGRARPGKT